MKRYLGGCSLLISILVFTACGQDTEVTADRRSSTLTAGADQSTADETETMQGAVAAGCGADLFSQQLASDPIENKGHVPVVGNYTIQAASTISLVREKLGLNIGTDFKLTSVKPEVARHEAEKTLAKLNGKRGITLLKTNWLDFFSASNNTDIKCSVFPASVLTTETNEGKTVVSFDPPLPFLISPGMAGEITRELSFNKITATVQQSADNTIKKGSTFQGTAVIRPVSTADYDADSAFEVIIDFGGVDKTTALGVLSDATYYVKGQTFKAIVIQTGNTATPKVTYQVQP